ncbi:MAG: hypothetical protein M3401_07390 [Actinomycetota bacterium]|nr:hypothetical protein [Actinomycetota bacterium]
MRGALRAHLLGVVLALTLFAGLVTGCGGDEDAGSGASAADGPFLTLSEIESVIEHGKLAVVRTAGDVDHPELDDAALLDSVRYASQSGRKFDVLVFANVSHAKRASPSVVDLESGESAIRAANVVFVFPERFSQDDTYRAVAQKLRELRGACTPGDSDDSDDERLRSLCFSDGGANPPPGAGVDRDEAAEEERPVVVGGLRYDPQIARRLNPHILPDRQLLSGRRPDRGRVWYGMFLRVCNPTATTETPSRELALVDAFGARIEPSAALPASNPFVYDTRPIAAGDCLPAKGSASERLNDGALVLFEVSPDVLTNFPLALEVTGANGERARSIVDV